MKTHRINISSFMVVAVSILLALAACSLAQPSPKLDADGVWFSADGSVNYRIQDGDSLISISKKVNVRLNTILEFNDLERETVIYPGQNILVGKIEPKMAATYLPSQPSQFGEGRDFVDIGTTKIVTTEGDLKPIINLEISGQLLDSCLEISELDGGVTEKQVEHTFYIKLTPNRVDGMPCNGESQDFFQIVTLSYEYLHPGPYMLEINRVKVGFVLEEAADYYPIGVHAVANPVWDLIAHTYDARPEFARIVENVWLDSCLGLGEPNESCVRVDTPGYLLIMFEGDTIWVYRTNADGSEIRGEVSEDASLLEPRSVDVTIQTEYLKNITVRSGPDNRYPLVGRVASGSVVTAIGVSEDHNWLLIQLPVEDGFTTAWLDSRYVGHAYYVSLPIVEPPPPPEED